MSSRKSSDGSLTLVLDGVVLLPAERERILRLSPRIEIVDGVSDEALGKAHVVYTSWGKFDPAKAPSLRWVQTNGAGVDKVLAGPLGSSRVPMANVKGAYTPAVAEIGLALMLYLTRCFPGSREVQACRQWPADRGFLCGSNLYGMTLGVVGYGSIGRHVARVASAMGMKVLACKRQPEVHAAGGFSFPRTGDPEGRIPRAWFGPAQLCEMLSAVDVALVALPNTPATRHIISTEALEAMPSHAYLVNVGRGTVIDEVALVEALRAGQIAGAGMDVFEAEPLDCDSPLWEMSNVVLTPHIGSWTRDQSVLAAQVLIENLSRELDGRPLINLIDYDLGY